MLKSILYKTFHLSRKLYSIMLYKLDGNHNEVISFKEIHKGHRAFIVCNGPSLQTKDLNMIHNNHEISFASNKIDKIFSKTNWRPTYYTVMDEGLQYSLLSNMNNVPAIAKFFRIESYSTTRKVKGKCYFLKTDGNRKLLENPKFSENCDDKIFTIATVTYAMLQLAVYMGIREIYIIGCDNSYGREVRKDGIIINNDKISYFEGSDEKDMKNLGYIWELNIAYEYARKYADEHGIKIYNATRGGHLEAFERIDFDSLF